MKTLKVEAATSPSTTPTRMSPPTFPASSTRSTTKDGYIPPWAISAPSSSSTATPAPLSKPPRDHVQRKGRTPARKGKRGRLLRRPPRDHPAAAVADFLTGDLTARGHDDLRDGAARRVAAPVLPFPAASSGTSLRSRLGSPSRRGEQVTPTHRPNVRLRKVRPVRGAGRAAASPSRGRDHGTRWPSAPSAASDRRTPRSTSPPSVGAFGAASPARERGRRDHPAGFNSVT
jgi:hypothetical protein